jgi:hypothetical protein
VPIAAGNSLLTFELVRDREDSPLKVVSATYLQRETERTNLAAAIQ